MASSILVDTSFLVAFLSRRDTHHHWAVAQAAKSPLPWKTCEPVLSEVLYLLGARGIPPLIDLLSQRALICTFRIDDNLEGVLGLLRKYTDVPMSLADACLVRMTEIMAEPILLTTDTDFRAYRRNGRQTIPCLFPR